MNPYVRWLTTCSLLLSSFSALIANANPALIAEGERLFFEETFDGNGRTCGTCHRAENNFTIDPEFIATLPQSDPLFVAENNPDLAELEDSALLRDFGLIRANLDGLEDPTGKFVMRSVSHTLAMSVSLQSDRTTAPFHQTGWSGDGAPGDGTLRDFSTGAVMQHYPKSLARVEGIDFRLPTEAELDAMEAFMLSLGRQNDFDLSTMELVNRDAERGRTLFLSEDSEDRTVQAAKCNICHRNAGALSDQDVNGNFDTGVENRLHPAGLLPRDGGFGTDPQDPTTGGFGDGMFNAPPLWEAADTAPYFHNNSALTLEDAIRHYDSNEFKQSFDGMLILANDSAGQEMAVETDALAAFLRVLNVLENMRSATEYLERAIGEGGNTKWAGLARADLEDVLQVLNQGELHESVQDNMQAVIADLDLGLADSDPAARNNMFSQTIDSIAANRASMVVKEAVAIAPPPVPGVDPSAPPPTPPEPTAPVVTLTSPADGTVVTGVVTITTDASANVTEVTFKVGSIELGVDTTAPYSFNWDTTTFAAGDHMVQAIGVDANGTTVIDTVTATIEAAASPPPDEPCTSIYGCFPGAPPPPPPSDPLTSSDSPDEVKGHIAAKDMITSTVSIITEEGTVEVLTISENTVFIGDVASTLLHIVIGHRAQAAFDGRTNEVLEIETDFPKN